MNGNPRQGGVGGTAGPAAEGGEDCGRTETQNQQPPGIKVLSSTGGGGGRGTWPSRSAFRFPTPAPPAVQCGAAPGTGELAAGADAGHGEKEPLHVVVHRGRVDLSEAWGGVSRRQPLESSRPKVSA